MMHVSTPTLVNYTLQSFRRRSLKKAIYLVTLIVFSIAFLCILSDVFAVFACLDKSFVHGRLYICVVFYGVNNLKLFFYFVTFLVDFQGIPLPFLSLYILNIQGFCIILKFLLALPTQWLQLGTLYQSAGSQINTLSTSLYLINNTTTSLLDISFLKKVN